MHGRDATLTTIRMSISIWATRRRSSAPIARRLFLHDRACNGPRATRRPASMWRPPRQAPRRPDSSWPGTSAACSLPAGGIGGLAAAIALGQRGDRYRNPRALAFHRGDGRRHSARAQCHARACERLARSMRSSRMPSGPRRSVSSTDSRAGGSHLCRSAHAGAALWRPLSHAAPRRPPCRASARSPRACGPVALRPGFEVAADRRARRRSRGAEPSTGARSKVQA